MLHDFPGWQGLGYPPALGLHTALEFDAMAGRLSRPPFRTVFSDRAEGTSVVAVP